jgi:hypothetical protein
MVGRALSSVAGLALAGALAACTPDFSDTISLVATPRLLAVQSIPAEGQTGSAFSLSALYVGPDGPADAGSMAWATCLLQNPLGDPGSVNPACFSDASTGLVSLGKGDVAKGVIPSNACELFGPESPPPLAGQPAARPTDPDSTGGFYLPICIETAGSSASVESERITCEPSGVTEAVFTGFTSGYVPNENPIVSSLARVDSDGSKTLLSPDGAQGSNVFSVVPGAVSTLQITWPTCPATTTACGGAETYILIDPTTMTLTTAHESMIASWYASAGTFALDRVGVDADDTATSVMNTWTAPTTPGKVHVWVVLRDARGGVGWASYTLDVEP